MKLFDNQLNIATEVIDHQYNNDEFKADLIKQFSIIKEKLDSGIYKNTIGVVLNGTETAKIAKLIKDRTGIQLKFTKDKKIISDNANNAAINVNTFNFINPLTMKDFREYVLEIIKQGNELGLKDKEVLGDDVVELLKKLSEDKATIDTKTGRVGGSYSNIAFETVIDFEGLFKTLKFTPTELAAVLMHEVGHAFTWMLFSSKMMSINAALSNIHTNRHKMDKDKLISVTFIDLKAIDKTIEEADVAKLLSDNVIMASLAYYNFIRKNTNMNNLSLNVDEYNSESNSESLADIYSIRMGFTELFGALNKLNKKYPERDSLFVLVITYIAMGLFGMLTGAGVFVAVIMVLLQALALMNTEMVYKNPKERLQKLINEKIDSLKGVEDAEYKANVLEELKLMRTLVDLTPNKYGPSSKILMTIFSGFRAKNSYADQQDILEKLASNELFVKSIELEMKAKG